MSASNWQGDTRLGVAPEWPAASAPTAGQDKRWEHAMTGLRIGVYEWPGNVRIEGAQGEVTGYAHGFVYVVLDGETEPRQMRWHEVRPARKRCERPSRAWLTSTVIPTRASRSLRPVHRPLTTRSSPHWQHLGKAGSHERPRRCTRGAAMSDLLREALIGADPLDPRWTWLGGAAERLREHAPADEDPGAMYECADVLDVLHAAIREALAIEPEYEYRAVASTRHPMPTGWFREAARAEGWLSLDPRYNAVERRVKAGQPERVQ